MYSTFFNNPNDCAIYRGENEITEWFYNTYYDDFIFGNYELVWNYVRENYLDLVQVTVSRSLPSDKNEANRSTYQDTASAQHYSIVDGSSATGLSGRYFELFYMVSGSYTVDTTLNQIVLAGPAILSNFVCQGGACYSCYYTNTIAITSRSSDLTLVNFSVSFDVYVDIYSVTFDGDVGPYIYTNYLTYSSLTATGSV